jgi:DNA polymerase-3 subunit delta'
MDSLMAVSGQGIWRDVVAQDPAVHQLVSAVADPRHAYLFLGSPGCTKDAAARAFAALVLDPSGDPDSRVARLVLAGEHPDVVEIRRSGAAIDVDTARSIVMQASRAPTEGDRKILMLHEFHLLSPAGAATLLKVVEEPPPSTMFVILADVDAPELITIASRCVKVRFRTLEDSDVDAALRARGIPATQASEAALGAQGDLDRALVLAADPRLAERRRVFADLPHHLDGTGATVIRLSADILELIEAAAGPLHERHREELEDLERRIETFGERGAGRKAMEDRHKREIRRHRTDELRAGLTAMARTYRDLVVDGAPTRRPDAVIHAVERLHTAMRHLDRNVNEALLLQALLYDLPTI